jgi:hypothetical protein
MTLKEKIYEFVGKKEKKSVEVTELGEKEFIYFTPITVLEMQMIRTKSEVYGSGPVPKIDIAAFNVWTIIAKAEDEAGQKIFTDIDKPILDQMPFYVILKIANAMHGVEPMESIMAKFKEGADPFLGTSSPSPTEKSAL